MSRKPYSFFVLTASIPSQTGMPSTCYTQQGETSSIRSEWAQFSTHQDVKAFAARNKIELNDINTYAHRMTSDML